MVDVEFDAGLALLTINRPHARKAISLDTMDQLEKALDAAEGDIKIGFLDADPVAGRDSGGAAAPGAFLSAASPA